MDRHDNLAVSVASTTAQRDVSQELTQRDQQSLHRLFHDLRNAMGASHRIVAVPHP